MAANKGIKFLCSLHGSGSPPPPLCLTCLSLLLSDCLADFSRCRSWCSPAETQKQNQLCLIFIASHLTLLGCWLLESRLCRVLHHFLEATWQFRYWDRICSDDVSIPKTLSIEQISGLFWFIVSWSSSLPSAASSLSPVSTSWLSSLSSVLTLSVTFEVSLLLALVTSKWTQSH